MKYVLAALVLLSSYTVFSQDGSDYPVIIKKEGEVVINLEKNKRDQIDYSSYSLNLSGQEFTFKEIIDQNNEGLLEQNQWLAVYKKNSIARTEQVFQTN